MKEQKCLCVIAVDASGSMLRSFDETGISKLSQLNKSLSECILNLKQNSALNQKLEICIIEIKDEVTILVKPTPIKEIVIPTINTEYGIVDSIGKGISTSIDVILQWKNRSFFHKILRQNHTPYLVLITDLSANDLALEEEEHPFIEKIYKNAKNKIFHFFALGIGEAELNSFFSRKENNLSVENKLNFNSFFKKISIDLDTSMNKHIPLEDEINLVFKYYLRIKKFILKRFKWIAISFVSLSFFNLSFSLVKINIINIELDKLISININKTVNYHSKYPQDSISFDFNLNKDWCLLGFVKTDIKYNYIFEELLDSYNLGEYSLSSSRKVFEAMNILLSNIDSLEKKFLFQGDIYVKIIGETDAAPIKNEIIYNGDLGNIEFCPFFIKNQENYELLHSSIPLNHKIEYNMELAFLRGFAMWDLLKRNAFFLITQQTHYQQIVKINDGTDKLGSKYRNVKIELVLKDVVLKK